jgi:acetyl-CoA carboxylase biotin carboxyl carrier protein
MVEFTRKDIEDLLRLIDGSNFDELKLEMGDLKLELRQPRQPSRLLNPRQ